VLIPYDYVTTPGPKKGEAGVKRDIGKKEGAHVREGAKHLV
jgi:hypothetical protein